MVIIDNDTFCIYKRLNRSKGKSIKWVFDEKRMFIKFPNLLQADMKANFLFDPTFKYFINFDY